MMSFLNFCVCILLLLAFSGANGAREDAESGRPYVFRAEDFSTLFKTQHGSLKLLPKFSQSSDLFGAIENVRMMILEAEPQTFLIPNHWDSDILFFVAQGRGTITIALNDSVKSFNIEKGHLMSVPAGYTFYMINRDDHEKFIFTGFIQPIGNADHIAPFFALGGQDPESYFHAFSPEVLETAFNTSSDTLQKMFSLLSKGALVKASKDQIKALTAEDVSPKTEYCKKDLGPCQILSYQTTHDEFGKVFMVVPTDYTILEQLNMYVSLSNTTQGCMNNPFYSTRATKIIVVVEGRGRVEIAVPETEEGSTRIRYKKITAELKPGVMFVNPPGHPMVLISSPDENLVNLNLEFNGKGNERWVLAGSENILKTFPKEAKELAFGISAEEVDKVLDRQRARFFSKGPRQVQGQGIANF